MAGDDALLGLLPLGLVFVGLLALLALAAFAGAAIRRRVSASDGERDEAGAALLSATLALLGLLIGFTFSMALARYDARRQMVVAESNAIGTAWLRAGLVDGPQGDKLRAAMLGYARQRAALPTASDPAAAEDASGAAQGPVWADMRAALPALPAPLAASLVGAVNDMFDAAASRRAEREARIPAHVLDLLAGATLLAGAIVGYVLGAGALRRHALALALLFALLALAITLILDLDRPWSGAITVSQAPMTRTLAGMR